jgi:hypothetical protein
MKLECIESPRPQGNPFRSHRLVGCVACAVLALLPMGQALAAGATPVAVPFTTNADGMVVLPAMLGSDRPIHVILDTGAGVDVLAASLVAKVQGKPAGQFTGFRMFGDRLSLPLFVIPELTVGPVRKSQVVMSSWDVLDQTHDDGIIAARDLRSQPFTIDFPGKIVVFETDSSLAERRKLGKVASLALDDQRDVALDLFARFLIGDQPALCSVDTGSPGTTVSTRFMAPLGVDPASPDVKKQERRAVESGATITRYWTNVPQLALAEAPQVASLHPRVSFADIIYDCVVGLDFLHDRVLTLDIARKQMIVR